MRRCIFILLTVLCSILAVISVLANPIDATLAEKIAKNFYNSQQTTVNSQQQFFDLIYTEKSNDGTPVYFVFNVNQKDGFVIVSANDATTTPILGYSTEGHYSPNNLPSSFEAWMGGYKEQIIYIIKNKIEATSEIKSKWQTYINNQLPEIKKFQIVGPFIPTVWDQGTPYNAMCPYDSTQKVRCPVGCVPLAMAQIMRYWKYPPKGIGSHTYTDATYGTQTADFGNTTYNWTNMPIQPKSKNDDVARLLYHCGVSVEAGYSVGSTGAFVINGGGHTSAQTAFTRYWGYDLKAMIGLVRFKYPVDSNWFKVLKKELDTKRPIMYRGVNPSTGGGHAFILDGYNFDNFHINWGWGGWCNGYYSLNNLTPSGDNYNDNNQAIIGIKPKTVGINEQLLTDSEELLIYPNPAQNSIKYQVSSIKFKGYRVLLYDNVGQLFFQSEITNPKSEIQTIDLSGFTNGLYFLQVLNNDRVYCKKFIINK